MPEKSNTDWGSLLESMEGAKSSSNLWFIRSGKTKVRLVPEGYYQVNGQEIPAFYTETESYWNGQSRKRFMLRGIVVEGVQPFTHEDDNRKVRGIVVPRTVLKAIIGLLSEGYDLLHPEKGHGITIVRSGEGLNTSYMVLPSPQPKPLPSDFIDLEVSMEELAEQYAQSQLDRDTNRSTQPQANQEYSSKTASAAEDTDW